MAGLSLAEALKNPAALGGPWKIYGTARRQMPSWFPSSVVDSFIFDALNSEDTLLKLSPISHQVTHLFWLAIQVRETEESNTAVNSTMLVNVLRVFKSLENSSKLRHITLQTGTKHLHGTDFRPNSRHQTCQSRATFQRRHASFALSQLLLRPRGHLG